MFSREAIERARVQAAYGDLMGRLAREHAHEQTYRKTLSERDNLVAAMARMVGDDQMARPDLWARFAVDNEALATLIADYLLARQRG